MLPLSDSLIRIGGFAISDCDFEHADRRIRAHLHSKSRLAVFFANTHFVVTCQPLRKKLTQMASVVILNDGIGLSIARRLLQRGRFKENLNGTDFIPRLLRESAKPLRIYLLGASKVSVEGAAEAFGKIANVEVAGRCDGYVLWSREKDVISDINAAKPDMLLVALGCPLQEQWIVDHFDALEVPVIFGVGALFDFVSGQHKRAPALMREAGLEWLYRLWREPRRLTYRYTVEILAFLRIVIASACESLPKAVPKLDRHVH
jgi:beta-1,4-glucosyltransferase